MSDAASRHRPTAGALLAVSLAAVLYLEYDAAAGFSRLPTWAALALLLASAACLVVLGAFGRGRTLHRVHLSIAAVLLGSHLLALNALIAEARLPSAGPEEAGIPRSVQRRAGRMRADLDRLMGEMRIVLESSRDRLAGFTERTTDAFHLLDRIEGETGFLRNSRGISLYSADGTVRSWAGTSYPPPDGLLADLPAGDVTFRPVVESQLTRLYGILASNDLVLLAEATLESRLAPEIARSELPGLWDDTRAVLRMEDFRAIESGFGDHFERAGDLREARTAGGRRYFFAALRAPDRTFLGYVRLQGVVDADIALDIHVAHRNAAALILTALFVLLCFLHFFPGRSRQAAGRDGGTRRLHFAQGLALIWGGRAVLSWFPIAVHLGGIDIFDPSLFASVRFFNLLRSPGDLFLTSMALLATALLVQRNWALVGRTARSRIARAVTSAAGWAVLATLGGLFAAYAPAATTHLVRNAAVDLLWVEPLSPSLPVLLIQVSVLAALLSFFLLALGAVSLIGAPEALRAACAWTPAPGDGISRWFLRALVPGIVFASLLYDPLLTPSSQRVVEAIIEQSLMPWVKDQRSHREVVLRTTIEQLEMMPDLVDLVRTSEDHSGASLALDVWLKTALQSSGYNASLLISNSAGRVISRFSRNLPPALDSRVVEPIQSTPEIPVAEEVSFLGLTKTVLHADHNLFQGDQYVGTVTVHMLDDLDNLPFLTPETPYDRALSPGARRITGLYPTTQGIGYAVYDSRGDLELMTVPEAPVLPARWMDLVSIPWSGQYANEQVVIWADQVLEGRPVRYLFFGGDGYVFALGFQTATLMERAARSIRVLFIGLGFILALLAAAAVLQPKGLGQAWWARIADGLRRTHYRKLLITFTTAALIPLILLSVVFSRYIRAQTERNIEDRGRQAMLSASSLMRAMLDDQESSKDVDDVMLYWLSLQVGGDVNLYGPEELIATSRRELFRSGLLSTRVDPAVYRLLELEGRRLVMGRGMLRGEEYRTITSPVSSSDGTKAGFLSLPLDAQAAEVQLRAREVGDVVLITSLLMVLLTGAVGYILARRVSRPIRSLSAAAARIAGGDLDAAVDAHPRDETGELIASFNKMARSIKEQQEDLRQRKDYIEKILLNATIGVISMERSGNIVTTNPAAATILDLPGLSVGSNLRRLIAGRPDLQSLAAALKDPAGPVARDVEMNLAASDRSVHGRMVPFLDNEGLILLLEDVTETVRSNRLAAWAEMARRIAHEIKNPLTPIQLSAEHIRRVHAEGSSDFPSVLDACLRNIMREVATLRQISSEFSTYARIPEPRREPTALSDLINQTVHPYSSAMPPGIEVRVEIESDLPTIEIDRSLVSRALINLMENALQAMPKGGVLTLTARRDANHLLVDVVDTGEGMDPASMARVFEPYFSTKDTGTGLGLAIARKAIEEHGGDIQVRSEAGKGTTMRIILPFSRDGHAPG